MMLLYGTKRHFYKFVNIFQWLFLKVVVIKLQYLQNIFLKILKIMTTSPHDHTFFYQRQLYPCLQWLYITYDHIIITRLVNVSLDTLIISNVWGGGLITEQYLQTVQHSYTVIIYVFFLDSHTIFMPKSPRFHLSGPPPP